VGRVARDSARLAGRAWSGLRETMSRAIGGLRTAMAGFSRAVHGLVGRFFTLKTAIVGVLGAAAVRMFMGAAKTQMAALERLGAVARASGEDWGYWRERVVAVTGELEKATGIADEEMQPALARMMATGLSLADALSSLELVLDIAAATGRDLGSVAEYVAAAMRGETEMIARLFRGMRDAIVATKSWSELQAMLAERVGGTAREIGETQYGAILRAEAAWGTVKEEIGLAMYDVLIPALQKATPILVHLAELFADFGILGTKSLAATGDAATSLQARLDFLTKVVFVVQRAFILLGGVAKTVFFALGTAVHGVITGVMLLKEAFEALWGIIKTIGLALLDKLLAPIQAVITGADALAEIVGLDLPAGLRNLEETIADVRAALQESTVETWNATIASFDFAGATRNVALAASETAGAFKGMLDQLRANVEAQEKALDRLRSLGQAQRDAKKLTEEQTKAIHEQSTALRKLGGQALETFHTVELGGKIVTYTEEQMQGWRRQLEETPIPLRVVQIEMLEIARQLESFRARFPEAAAAMEDMSKGFGKAWKRMTEEQREAILAAAADLESFGLVFTDTRLVFEMQLAQLMGTTGRTFQVVSEAVAAAADAFTSAFTQWIEAGYTAAHAAKMAAREMLRETLMAIAKESIVRAVYATATGLLNLALFQFEAAAKAFAAAAAYAMVGTLAARLGAGLAAPAPAAPAAAPAAPAPAAPAPAMPMAPPPPAREITVTVNVLGNVIPNDEFARDLAGTIREAVGDNVVFALERA